MDVTEAKNLALSLMKEHGLKNWNLRLMKSKYRAGTCLTRYWSPIPKVSYGIISLSTDFIEVQTVEEVRDTILHEIGHALTDPKFRAHGPEWKAITRKIGGSGSRCVDPNHARPEPKWTGICVGGHKHTKNRLTWDMKVSGYCLTCKKETKDLKLAKIEWVETKTLKSKVVKSEKPAKIENASKNNTQLPAKLSYKEMYDLGHSMLDDAYLGD